MSDMSDMCDISDICGISVFFVVNIEKRYKSENLLYKDMMSNLDLVFSIIINRLWFKLKSCSKGPNPHFIHIIAHKSRRFCN